MTDRQTGRQRAMLNASHRAGHIP